MINKTTREFTQFPSPLAGEGLAKQEGERYAVKRKLTSNTPSGCACHPFIKKGE
jgi:hypothetical protein